MKSNSMFNALDGSLKCGAVLLAVLQVFAAVPQPAYGAPAPDATPKTTTPIKNVIIIIGENRTFDHVYGTYVPKNGQTVWNLSPPRRAERLGAFCASSFVRASAIYWRGNFRMTN